MNVFNHAYSPNERLYRVFEDIVVLGAFAILGQFW